MENTEENTDRELFRLVEDDYYSPSVHVTIDGAIGMNIGGSVVVQDIKTWHKQAKLSYSIKDIEWSGECPYAISGTCVPATYEYGEYIAGEFETPDGRCKTPCINGQLTRPATLAEVVEIANPLIAIFNTWADMARERGEPRLELEYALKQNNGTLRIKQ